MQIKGIKFVKNTYKIIQIKKIKIKITKKRMNLTKKIIK